MVVPIVLLCALCLPFLLQGGQAYLEYGEDGVFKEVRSGRMWQVERSRRLSSADDVEEYLTSLNGGKYNDWRLPTKEELFELYAVFDLKNNGEVKIQLEGGYWLIGEDSKVQVGSWEIGDDCGPERRYFTKKAGYLRAVRP
jgi:hypothetical protein